MPKVKLSEQQETKKRLINNLLVIKGRRTDRDMAKIMGISASTYSRREHDPFSLTAIETYLMCSERGVDMADFYGKTLRETIGV